MNYFEKISLGTAQFGMDYGANNHRGKIPYRECFEILENAKSKGILQIDTAPSYGNAEKVLGSFRDIQEFKITTKYSDIQKCPIKSLEESLDRLRVDQVECLMFHSFQSFIENRNIIDKFVSAKSKNLCKKIGFSLYSPQELIFLIKEKVPVDTVQVPYSIFDQRFENIMHSAREKEIEVCTRSAFLQGIVFKDLEDLHPRFSKVKLGMESINQISDFLSCPKSAMYLGFCMLNKNIQSTIVGVDSIDNFEQNLLFLKHLGRIRECHDILLSLSCRDEREILPTMWN